MTLIGQWLDRAAAEVEAAVPLLNANNLFPVADADTGTNMLVTVKAAAIGGREGGLPGASRAALIDAAGNSGVILSEILRGLAESIDHGWRAAWIRANEVAQAAVVKPMPGTMLSVSSAVARSAQDLDPSLSDPQLLYQLWQSAREAALATAMDPPIASALGIVDAGAHGLERVIGALSAVANGHECTALPVSQSPNKGGVLAITTSESEVMFLLEGCSDLQAEQLRARLREIGDSVLVVGSEELWNVHVHCVDAAAAIEAGLAHGTPKRIRITPLTTVNSIERAIIVVSNGPGLSRILSESGAQVISAIENRADPQAFIAAAADVTEAILMPHSRSSAQAAAGAIDPLRQAGVRVSVLPTRSPVQVLAALAVHNPDASFDDDVVAMAAAAGQTRYATLAIAKRDAMTTAGPCRTGDVLGLIGGDVVLIGHDVAHVAKEIVDRFIATGGELLTLIAGDGIPKTLMDELSASVKRSHPEIDVQQIDGGQLYYPLLIGLE